MRIAWAASWAIWVLMGLLVVALFICIWRIAAGRREILRMYGQIQSFLNGEMSTPNFSVRDNRFALFENAVVELESKLLLSEANARAESAKSRAFVQDVSHQFKTPIAGLRLFCEMDESAHQARKLQLIERMEALIAALLKLEKLRAGGYALDFVPCELRELALDARAQFLALYPRKQIRIFGEGRIRCDAHWMYEALGNLVKNACEHTLEDGCIEVIIEPSKTEVMVRVEDDGGGVEEEALGRLFERFCRVGRQQSAGGVGLGLSIVRTIVMQHHGTVRALNGEKGLAVVMYIPMLDGNLK